MGERVRLWTGRACKVAAAAGLVVMVWGYFVPDDSIGTWMMAAGFGLLLLPLCLSEWLDKPRLKGRGPVKTGSSRDVEQWKWASTTMLMPVAALPLCMLSSQGLWGMATAGAQVQLSKMWLGPLAAACAFVVLWSGLKNKVAQRWLNDELMRTYHASAMEWGFLAAFLGLAATFGLMLWRQPVALAAMPFVFWIVVAIANSRLWWQVRQGEGG